jgi:hypothetical protein
VCLMETKLLADIDGVSSMSKKVSVIGLEKIAKLCKHVTLQGSEGRYGRR